MVFQRDIPKALRQKAKEQDHQDGPENSQPRGHSFGCDAFQQIDPQARALCDTGGDRCGDGDGKNHRHQLVQGDGALPQRPALQNVRHHNKRPAKHGKNRQNRDYLGTAAAKGKEPLIERHERHLSLIWAAQHTAPPGPGRAALVRQIGAKRFDKGVYDSLSIWSAPHKSLSHATKMKIFERLHILRRGDDDVMVC